VGGQAEGEWSWAGFQATGSPAPCRLRPVRAGARIGYPVPVLRAATGVTALSPVPAGCKDQEHDAGRAVVHRRRVSEPSITFVRCSATPSDEPRLASSALDLYLSWSSLPVRHDDHRPWHAVAAADAGWTSRHGTFGPSCRPRTRFSVHGVFFSLCGQGRAAAAGRFGAPGTRAGQREVRARPGTGRSLLAVGERCTS